MNVFGKSFEYNGQSSTDYNVQLCTFDSSDENRETAISYSLLTGDITPNRHIPNFYAKKYNEPLEFSISLLKGCGENRPFTTQEQKEIIRWLTSPKEHKLFKVVDYDGEDYHTDIEYFCLCTSYNEVVINGLTGMEFTFKCNAPFGFYPEQITEFTAPVSIDVENHSDELFEDYYPVIELECNKTGEVTFTNSSFESDVMTLQCVAGQTLYIDCQLGDITDNLDLFDYSTDTNLIWLKLAHGINTINITGDVAGKIRCRYMRKAGI